MKLHGCHNRPPLKSTLVVFDGYRDEARTQVRTKEVPSPFDDVCKYTVEHPQDPHCAGCKHANNHRGQSNNNAT